MSFGTAMVRFAAIASAARAEAYSGEVDANGLNIQVGEVKARVPFARLTTFVDFRQHGRTIRCTASILLRPGTGITIDENSILIHLPTGDRYEVLRTGAEYGLAEEKHYLLHRLED